MDLTEFNTLSTESAVDVVRPALDIPRWLDEVVAARPFSDVDALLAAARTAADPFSDVEVERALAHHPRIGERASGEHAEASMSRDEQAAVDPSDADVQRRLQEGNRAYEEKFDQVFLIRAAGRSPEEILAQLSERLDNDPETERRIVADQLRQIALLRIERLITA